VPGRHHKDPRYAGEDNNGQQWRRSTMVGGFNVPLPQSAKQDPIIVAGIARIDFGNPPDAHLANRSIDGLVITEKSLIARGPEGMQ
jgi:hypothetical protein